MDRDQVISTLQRHEKELKDAGVLHLSLFGSVARGDHGPDSDVDIAVGLGKNFSEGGWDYFWKLEQLQVRLSKMLECAIDVQAEPVKKISFQEAINRDRALAF